MANEGIFVWGIRNQPTGRTPSPKKKGEQPRSYSGRIAKKQTLRNFTLLSQSFHVSCFFWRHVFLFWFLCFSKILNVSHFLMKQNHQLNICSTDHFPKKIFIDDPPLSIESRFGATANFWSKFSLKKNSRRAEVSQLNLTPKIQPSRT